MNIETTRLAILLAPLALAAAPAAAQVSGTVTRASVSSTGTQANNASITNSNTPLSISADGRFVAFNSAATNLIAGDTNGAPDVFVRDLLLGTTVRASVSSSGQQGNADSYGRGSYGTSLSADGRYVAFYSYSSNLVSGDSGGLSDVFVHDNVSGATVRASLSTSNKSPNGASQSPSISADGRYVLFDSAGSNLVSSDRNKAQDVFVRDLWTGTTQRVSVSSAGNEANGASSMYFCGQSLSADGHYAAFISQATNLVAGDTNGQADVFVRDLWFGTTERVNLTSSGAQANGVSAGVSISADGRFVAFRSYAANLAPPGAPAGVPQLHVHDRVLHSTQCASVSSIGVPSDRALNFHAALSADGRYVAFIGSATNFVPGATTNGYNLFLRDLVLGTTTCPTASSGGWPWNGSGGEVAMDALGLTVAFDSLAASLVSGDTNGVQDVFVVQ